MARDNETLPLDSEGARRVMAPALPFGEAASTQVACASLDAPVGAPRVPLALGTVLWRSGGGPLRLTVIARAAFSMLASPPMAPAEPDAFRTTDAFYKNRPLAHVVAASDRAPYKPSVDVTLLGHARAPGGRPVPEVIARFSLRQGGQVALDKAVRVVGDRGEPGAAPAPFDAIPVVYDRARGGRDAPANPIGRSQDDDEPPNLLNPTNPLRPAGFGPLASAWRIRSQRLGDVPKRALDEPVLNLPHGFDWSYFQAAPSDQTLGALAPDAVLVLEGFHADWPHVEVALPSPRAVGAVYGLDPANPDAPTPLVFRADTLHVDADRWLCSITFRAYVEVRDEVAQGRVLVAAGVGVGGRDPVVPERRPQATGQLRTAASKPRAAAGVDATLDISGTEAQPVSLPFGKRPPAPVIIVPPEPAPAPQPAQVAATPPAPPVAAPPAPERKASPWAPAPPPAAPAPPPPPEKRPPRRVDVQGKLYRKR